MRYRPEIDGLRAFAVAAVMMYHAGFGKAAGGFVGVDVFFVISGYLITLILKERFDAGRFGLWEFYERRARRILPALGLVMLCCLPLAVLGMFPFELQGFGKSLVTTVSFTSNIGFWGEENYFSTAHQMKPLGHVWSLAVEEQFYLIYPVLLWALWRMARGRQSERFVVPALAVLAATSLGAAVWMVQVDRAAAFFLLPFRAWELLAGAICALVPVARPGIRWAGLLALGGLAAIGWAMADYASTVSGPGLAMLVPVIGAVLVLRYGTSGTACARLLSLPPFVGLGLVSYGAYLWHQPVLAFGRWFIGEQMSNPTKGVLILLSIMLAVASWRWVEMPVRRGWPVSRLRLFGGAVAASVFFAATGFVLYAMGGFPQRFDARVLTALAAARDASAYNVCQSVSLDPPTADARCVLGDTTRASAGPVDFVLIGDSFAAALGEGVDLAAKAAGQRGLVTYVPSCPAILGLGGNWYVSRTACARFQDSMVQQVAATKTRHVVLAGSWNILTGSRICDLERVACRFGQPVDPAIAAHAVAATVAAFRAKGIEVTVIGAPPKGGPDVPRAVARSLLAGESGALRFADIDPAASGMMQALDKITPPVRQVDIRPFFCKDGLCDMARNGLPLFRDSGHITATTSRRLAPLLSAVFTGAPQ